MELKPSDPPTPPQPARRRPWLHWLLRLVEARGHAMGGWRVRADGERRSER